MNQHPGFDVAEEARKSSAHMIVGTVFEADYKKARVRVKDGDWESDWLPWMTGRAGPVRIWSPPQIGEQVTVHCPDGDPAQGVIMPGSLNQDAHPPNSDDPNVTRIDLGPVNISIDRSSGAISINTNGALTISAASLDIEKAG